MEKFKECAAEKDDLLLRLRDFRVSKEISERKVSKREVSLKPRKASKNRLESKMSALENKNRLF